ncbi:MAG: hypothetical protein HYY16_00310 [Planctomycetes bacterium]|nr:hypothetical protein [Planctomycetota bacterium]
MRFEGTWKLSMDYSYKHGDKLIRGHDVDHKNKIGVENLWTRLTVGLEHGLTDQLTLHGEMNYQLNEREEGVKNNYYQAHGFGDLVLGGRTWFLEPDLADWNFFVGLDTRFPTGDDDDRWKGQFKKSYILPGTGQWGLLPSAGFYKGLGDFALTGAVGGVFSLNKNDAGYESADVAHAALGASWVPFQLGPQQKTLIGTSLFATAIWIPENDTRDGVTVGNTGGEWYNIVPGVFFSPDGGNFTAYLSIPITAYATVHDLQCYEAYSVSFGVQYRF